MNFTAIDFETARGQRNSICQVGIVRVEGGKIVSELELLVQPPGNEYQAGCTYVHGLDARHTANEPTFDALWPRLKPYIAHCNVVAHNGFAFDFNVLGQTLQHYGLPVPRYKQYCTYRIYGERLADLCERYSIPLNHHEALSDARACATLFQLHLKGGAKR